jgi:hypothetical protein
MHMATMDKAVEVSAPSSLRIVERAISEPGSGQVRIRVEMWDLSHRCGHDKRRLPGVEPPARAWA